MPPIALTILPHPKSLNNITLLNFLKETSSPTVIKFLCTDVRWDHFIVCYYCTVYYYCIVYDHCIAYYHFTEYYNFCFLCHNYDVTDYFLFFVSLVCPHILHTRIPLVFFYFTIAIALIIFRYTSLNSIRFNYYINLFSHFIYLHAIITLFFLYFSFYWYYFAVKTKGQIHDSLKRDFFSQKIISLCCMGCFFEWGMSPDSKRGTFGSENFLQREIICWENFTDLAFCSDRNNT